MIAADDTALDALPDTPFSYGDIAARGVSRWALDRLRDTGRVERIARGLYRRTDLEPADLDLAEAVIRAPEATLCLVSALTHHGLVDEIPRTIDLALPSGRRLPATAGPITWHRFDAETFDVGRGTTAVDGTSLRIGLYSPERSVVDAFRLRHSAGYEIADEALRSWLSRPGSTPARLLDIANQLPRAQGPLRTALTYLA